MDAEQGNSDRSVIDFDALVDFISSLRDDYDYNIGAFKFIAAQDLILALAARGESVLDADVLRQMLRPILCSSPAEQSHFDEHFEAWTTRLIRDKKEVFRDDSDAERDASPEREEVDDDAKLAASWAKSRTRQRLVLFLIIFVALFLTALLVLPEKISTISLAIDPIDADVFVVLDSSLTTGSGSQLHIGKTPLPPFSIPEGTHGLIVRKNGYVEYSELLTISSGSSAELEIQLSRIERKESYRVRFSQPNARVFIDGPGEIIHLENQAVEIRIIPGVYNISVEHPLCTPYSEIIVVQTPEPGQNESLIQLECEAAGRIDLRTNVRSATVFLDNLGVGYVRPDPNIINNPNRQDVDYVGHLLLNEIGTGIYSLSIESPGYDTFVGEITVTENETLGVDVVLEAAEIVLDKRPEWTRPPGDRIAFDGKGSSVAVEDEQGGIVVLDLDNSKRSRLHSPHDLLLTKPGASTIDDGDDGDRYSWAVPVPFSPIEDAHSWNVRSLSFHPSSWTLASGGWDGAVRVWDLSDISRADTDFELRDNIFPEDVLREPVARLDPRAKSMVAQVAYSPVESRLAFAVTNGLTTIDAKPIEENDPGVLFGNRGQALSVAWSPDGKTVMTGNDKGSIDMLVSTGDSATMSLRDRIVGHVGPVTSLSFHPDGSRLASSSGDGKVKIWNVTEDTFELLDELVGHPRYVEVVAYSPTGSFLASAGQDNVIRIWDSENGREVAVLEGHTDRIVSLAFSPDGEHMVTGSWDSTVRIWSTISMREIANLPANEGHVWSVAWSPNGNLIASGGRDGVINLWWVRSLRKQTTPVWFQNAVRQVAISPSNQFVVTADREGDLVVWDALSQTPVDTLVGHTAPVSSLSYSRDGRIMATGAADSTVKIWSGFVRMEHDAGIREAHYDPTGRRIVSVDTNRVIRLWDGFSGDPIIVADNSLSEGWWDAAEFVRNGKALLAWGGAGVKIIEIDSPGVAEMEEGVYVPVPYPFKRYLPFKNHNGDLHFYDLASGKRMPGTIQHDFGYYFEFEFSPNGEKFLLTGELGSQLFSVSGGNAVGPLIPKGKSCEDSYQITPDNRKVIAVQCTRLYLLTEGAGAEPERIPAAGFIVDIKISSDSRRLLVSSLWMSQENAGGLALWDISSVKPEPVVNKMAHTDGTLGATFSPSEAQILSWGDYKVYLWDSNSGQSLMTPILPLKQFRSSPGDSLAGIGGAFFSPSGTRFIFWDRENNIHIRHSVDGAEQFLTREMSHPADIVGVEMNPAETHLLSWDDDGELRIWNANTGDLTGGAESQDGMGVDDATFSHDGRKIYTQLVDQSQQMWDTSTGKIIGRSFDSYYFPPDNDPEKWLSWNEKGVLVSGNSSAVDVGRHNGKVSGAVLSPDGRRIASVGTDDELILWDTVSRAKTDSVSLSKRPTSIAFSEDGKKLAAVFEDHSVQIFQTQFSRSATASKWFWNGGWLFILTLIVVFVGVYFTLRHWALKKAREFLQRDKKKGTPQSRFDAPNFMQEALFPARELRELARRMRTRVEVPSRSLHIENTIRASVAQAGILSPVFDTRTEIPEYLVLIERTSFKDHQAQYFENILSRLEADEVFITKYMFSGKPDLLIPTRPGEKAQTLASLAARISNHRLIIIGSAECLFSDITGETERWYERLLSWRDRTLITPVHADHWGFRELRLLDDFVVLPGTVEGLSRFRKPLQNYLGGLGTGQRPSPLPPILDGESRRWLADDLVEPEMVTHIHDALSSYLDEDGMLWLCACALYPQMDWKLTLQLGYGLRGSDGSRLLDSARLLRLSRLPWFRRSYMPEWMRDTLQRRLTEAQMTSVRSILSTLIFNPSLDLRDPLDAVTLAGELDTAHDLSSEISEMSISLAQKRAQEAPEKHPLNDALLLGFLAGKHPDPLAVRFTRAIEKWIRLENVRSRDAHEYEDLGRVNRAFAGAVVAVTLAVVFFWSQVPKSSQTPSIIQELPDHLSMEEVATRVWQPAPTEPAEITSMMTAANDLLSRGAFTDGLSLLNHTIAKDIDNIDVLLLRAQVWSILGEIDASESDLERVLEIDPENDEAFDALFPPVDEPLGNN